MNQKIIAGLKEKFAKRFQGSPLLARAPGRINLIGEHTDYNNGYVLPAAIDKAIYVAVSKRDDQIVSLHSVEYGESCESSMDDLRPVDAQWPNYMLGVASQLKKKKSDSLSGFNLLIDGDIPLGAGLSSSAAVECATAAALNSLFDLKISSSELTSIAQKAEHEFAGVLCGIMDQFASTFGKKDHVIRLDCRSMEYVYEPLNLNAYQLVLFNTNVKHSLASTEYNIRRQECAQGVAILQAAGESVDSLRDATLEMLNKHVKPADEVLFRRCRYVVEENNRLLKACRALESGDLASVGSLMFASHHGLKNDYEVSCRELDFLVDAVKQQDAVTGARMMGGGFGGCTINLVKKDAVESLYATLEEAYNSTFNNELSMIVVETADGASLVE